MDSKKKTGDNRERSQPLTLHVITFYRTEVDKSNGKSEIGVIINEGEGPIIDSKGRVVPNVWDYHNRPMAGVMVVETNSEFNACV